MIPFSGQATSPPVYIIVLKELLCSTTGMFWIIVLHEPVVSVRKFLLEKGDECFFEDLRVEFSIHYPTKYDIGVAPRLLMPAQTCTLTGCLGRGLGFGLSPLFR